MTAQPHASASDRYVYDPLDVRPAERESQENDTPLTDQRLVLEFGIDSMFWEKSYNSGGDVAAESVWDARTAHVTLVHDAEHASVLEIPIGR